MAIRLGIIGTGKMAARIMPHLKNTRELETTCLFDTEPAAMKEFSEKHGLNAALYSSYESFFRDGDFEAVYIATPPHVHAEYVLQAARAGRHVLCEKPMALTLRDAEQIVDACRDAGVLLNVGYMMRFQVYHTKIRQVTRNGVIGKLTRISAERTCYFEPASISGWFTDPDQSGGGALSDLGCHVIDLVCFFAESRVRTAKMISNKFFPGDTAVEDRAMVALEFENGIIGSAYASWCCPLHDNLLQIYGTQGAIVARRTIGPYEDGSFTIYRTDEQPRTVRLDYVSHYELELKHFADCVLRGEQSDIASGQAVLDSERARFLAYEDSQSGGRRDV